MKMRVALLSLAAAALVSCPPGDERPEMFTIDKGCDGFVQGTCYSTVILRRPKSLDVAVCNVVSSQPAPGTLRDAGGISCQRQTLPQGAVGSIAEWSTTIPRTPSVMESDWKLSFWRLQRTPGNWYVTYCLVRMGSAAPPTCTNVGGPLW